jgi:hypothetical protein
MVPKAACNRRSISRLTFSTCIQRKAGPRLRLSLRPFGFHLEDLLPEQVQRQHPWLQQVAKGLDAGGRPVGEVGQGAILDFVVLAEGFAQEKGRRGVAVGEGGDIHGRRYLEFRIISLPGSTACKRLGVPINLRRSHRSYRVSSRLLRSSRSFHSEEPKTSWHLASSSSVERDFSLRSKGQVSECFPQSANSSPAFSS